MGRLIEFSDQPEPPRSHATVHDAFCSIGWGSLPLQFVGFLRVCPILGGR